MPEVIGYIKGKNAIDLACFYGERKRDFVRQHFWARGYFVFTLARDETVIWERIERQEQQDNRLDQLNLSDRPPSAGQKTPGSRQQPKPPLRAAQSLQHPALAGEPYLDPTSCLRRVP